MKNDKFYIEDIGSKHGTYIRIKSPIIINDDVPRQYLYNNHLFSVQMEWVYYIGERLINDFKFVYLVIIF